LLAKEVEGEKLLQIIVGGFHRVTEIINLVPYCSHLLFHLNSLLLENTIIQLNLLKQNHLLIDSFYVALMRLKHSTLSVNEVARLLLLTLQVIYHVICLFDAEPQLPELDTVVILVLLYLRVYLELEH
jgi:hypothetical protein